MTAKRSQLTILLAVGFSFLPAASLEAHQQLERESKPEVRGAPAANTPAPRRSVIVATGTLEPEKVLDISADVSGPIKALGTDADGKTVDYQSTVKKGQILAQIDPTLYEADVRSSAARKKVAEARLRVKKAELARLQIIAEQAKQRLDKNSTAEMQKLKNEYDVARANIAVCDAECSQAEAMVAETQAELDRAQASVDSCTIHCPVEGIIIDRRIVAGQRIISGLSAPSIFLVAEDLKRMQVWVAVNEVDVAHIKAGRRVRFTVTGFPGETFAGTVKVVRLNATMTGSRVQYTVEVDTDNSDGRLLPYLTADVRFEVGGG